MVVGRSFGLIAITLLIVTVFSSMVQSARAPTSAAVDCSLASITSSSPSVLTNEQLRSCMQGIPFDATTANMTIAGLREAMQMYVFRDIVRDSPTYIISLNIDIDAELAAIGNTNWGSDYEFQQAIADLYQLLRDPHTLYLKSSLCYDFFVVQPYTLGFVVEVLKKKAKPTTHEQQYKNLFYDVGRQASVLRRSNPVRKPLRDVGFHKPLLDHWPARRRH